MTIELSENIIEAIADAVVQKMQEPKWIPVSKSLPSDYGYDWVLAQIQEPDTGYLWIPCVAEYRKGIDDWFSDANDIGWLRNHKGEFKVIAWMPLPKRYVPDTKDRKVSEIETEVAAKDESCN